MNPSKKSSPGEGWQMELSDLVGKEKIIQILDNVLGYVDAASATDGCYLSLASEIKPGRYSISSSGFRFRKPVKFVPVLDSYLDCCKRIIGYGDYMKRTSDLIKKVVSVTADLYLPKGCFTGNDFSVYSKDDRKKAWKEFNTFNRYNSPDKDKRAVNEFGEDFLRTLERIVYEKAKTLPMNDVEKRLLDLSDRYSITFWYKKMNFKTKAFSAEFTMDDLDIVEALFRTLPGLNMFFNNVYKENGKRDFSKEMPRRLSKIANMLRSSEFYAEIAQVELDKEKDSLLPFDQCELDALRSDFQKYLPIVLRTKVTRIMFNNMPSKQRLAYTAMVVPEFHGAFRKLKAYGLSENKDIESFARFDFVNSCTSYIMSKLGSYDCNMRKEKKEYFDNFFRLRVR
ncbi:hypothetical protein KY330_05345 [Candidatus Woesearchaeota archaeon]|nr:hypothetical protein [Candidatus Woesearchaeota archaeon]